MIDDTKPKDDLLHRLRSIGTWTLHHLTTSLCEEAAVEIERLRKLVGEKEK